MPLLDKAATERLVLASPSLATLGQPTLVPLSPVLAELAGGYGGVGWGGVVAVAAFIRVQGRCLASQEIHR